MPFRDNVVLFRSRLAANLPQATLSDQSLFMGLAQAFLSADADTQALITASQPDMFLVTASGLALDRKAADYGARRAAGRPAHATLVFTLDQPAASTLSIPAGTLVSTVGDGLVTDAIFFATDADTSIFAGGTTATVTATATILGAVGNVAAHTIIVLNSGLMGGLLSVDNPTAAVDGADPDSDGTLRAQAFANLLGKYAPGTLEAAILSVQGTFDAYVSDPQNGGGYIDVYWSDQLGNQPGLTYTGPGAATFDPLSLADLVNLALVRVLPPNILVHYHPFEVFDVLPSVTYLAPATFTTGELTPLIQQAVAGYINGLRHGQAVALYGLVQAVSSTLGSTLVDLVPRISPSLATTQSSPTLLYRYSGDPLSIHVERLT